MSTLNHNPDLMRQNQDGSSLNLSPPKPAVRRVFIKSYGCQMNVYDANRMGDALLARGYTESSELSQADLVILNTCHIREKATEKVFSELGRLKDLREQRALIGEKLGIVVAGCVAQAEGKEILRRQPAVDLVIGSQNYHRLPDLLVKAEAFPNQVDTDFPIEDKFDHLPMPTLSRVALRGVSAFVTVQEGCDKFCTFCVVPYTRGAETSRPVQSILKEVATLATSGVREIVLIGQNVNAYQGLKQDGKYAGLAELIQFVSKINSIIRVRYTTSHPCDMQDDLIYAHRDVPQLMPNVHLPAQSGSDRVLKAMNRNHTRADYLATLERIRRVNPEIAFTSDFIVGFPGETDDEFAETLSLVEAVDYSDAFCFMYSPRAGTGAAALADHVPDGVKRDRLSRLQALIQTQRAKFVSGVIGQKLEVLFEKKGRYDGQIIGKSPLMHNVHVEGPVSLIGMAVDVEIIAFGQNSLRGRIVRSTLGSRGESTV